MMIILIVILGNIKFDLELNTSIHEYEQDNRMSFYTLIISNGFNVETIKLNITYNKIHTIILIIVTQLHTINLIQIRVQMRIKKLKMCNILER